MKFQSVKETKKEKSRYLSYKSCMRYIIIDCLFVAAGYVCVCLSVCARVCVYNFLLLFKWCVSCCCCCCCWRRTSLGMSLGVS